jgi:hypothetical protein
MLQTKFHTRTKQHSEKAKEITDCECGTVELWNREELNGVTHVNRKLRVTALQHVSCYFVTGFF